MSISKNLFDFDTISRSVAPISEEELSDELVIEEIKSLKDKLKDKVVILGHHYQSDEIIQFADVTGDSLILAQKASNLTAKYIIFCGVHFMAETADILKRPEQMVILPDPDAGCTMADMASSKDVENAWEYIKTCTNEKIIPITYVNCSAELKSFVGKNGGSICTSSNAEKIIKWGLDASDKLLFFPDQHLGRNTCYKLGIPLEKQVIYNPTLKNGGLTKEQVRQAKVILWYGYCSVHQGFTKEHVEHVRATNPKMKIIVHPECSFDVVAASDASGSTAFIVKEVENAPAGSEFAVGTEINLVNRLAKNNPDKKIISLSPYQCICSTMYRVRPRWLLTSLRSVEQHIEKNVSIKNVITVKDDIKINAKIALDRMLL